MPVFTIENHCLEGKLTFDDPLLDSGVVQVDDCGHALTLAERVSERISLVRRCRLVNPVDTCVQELSSQVLAILIIPLAKSTEKKVESGTSQV